MQPVSYTYQPNTNPANHRYGYQGEFAEKDRETGFNHFELRDYDSRIGRWFAPDPYNQFISPYTGMGNNPIFHIDPNGGYCSESYYSKMRSVREAVKNISRNRNAMHEYWMQNHTSGGQSMNLASGSGMVNATCTTSEGDVIWVEGYVQALEYTVIEGSNYRSHGGQLYYTGGSPSVDVYYREVNSNNETVDMGVMEMSEFLDFAMDFYSQTAAINNIMNNPPKKRINWDGSDAEILTAMMNWAKFLCQPDFGCTKKSTGEPYHLTDVFKNLPIESPGGYAPTGDVKIKESGLFENGGYFTISIEDVSGEHHSNLFLRRVIHQSTAENLFYIDFGGYRNNKGQNSYNSTVRFNFREKKFYDPIGEFILGSRYNKYRKH